MLAIAAPLVPAAAAVTPGFSLLSGEARIEADIAPFLADEILSVDRTLVAGNMPLAPAPLSIPRLEYASTAAETPVRYTEKAGRALECLTAAVYYEARSESENGQRAVAQVVLNRARHPAYPSSVCGVVYQGAERSTGCQFSFTCDGSTSGRREPAAWARARRIAGEALGGYVHASVGSATHYHTHAVSPVWARQLSKLTALGQHVFYRSSGAAGELRRAALADQQ